MWDLADGREVLTLRDKTPDKGLSRFGTVEYGADGRSLVFVATGLGGWLGGWNAETGQARPSVEVSGFEDQIVGEPVNRKDAAFSPDRRRIALPLRGQPLGVYDATNGKLLFSTDAIADFAAFSPDGGRIVCGDGKDQTLVVCDAQTGRRIASLKEYLSPAVAATFSPDGRRLAAVSGDGVRVWNLETRNEVLSLKGMTSVAVQSGRPLAGRAAPDGNVRVWNVGAGD